MAQKLSMTVEEMRARMSGQEWLEWWIYYSRIAQRQQMAAMMKRR